MWRLDGDAVEILVVHRPRFDDWSLPKGKLKRGEHRLAAAVREVLEESGIRGCPGPRLPAARYEVRVGEASAAKEVDFWAMRVVEDMGFVAGDEVDDRRWLPIGRALRRLSYPHDRAVVRALAAMRPPLQPPIVVIRHAQAGGRWTVRDEVRPLTTAGLNQARRLARLLTYFVPTRLISASPLRCRQTMEPLAADLGLPIEVDGAFDEDADPEAAARRLAALAGTSAVVCSQGGLIGPALASLDGSGPSPSGTGGGTEREPWHTRKGEGWVLTFNARNLARIDPLA